MTRFFVLFAGGARERLFVLALLSSLCGVPGEEGARREGDPFMARFSENATKNQEPSLNESEREKEQR